MRLGSESFGFASFVLAGLIAFTISSASGVAQEEKEPNPPDKPEGEPEAKGRPSNAEGYDEYVTVADLKYVPPEKGGAQVLQLKLDLIDDIPKGCIVRMTLDLNGIPEDETTFTLTGETRKGIAFSWKLSKKVALGEYQIRTHIDLEKQPPAVQKLIKQNAKRFPPKSAPWSWYAKTFNLGTPEDENRERDEICEIYTGFLDRVLENLGEFKEAMDKALKGEDLAQGGSLDSKKFETFVKEWREKQGALQKEILTFQGKNPSLVQKTLSAYKRLLLFGQMASKRAILLQKEVADKYKATDPNPAVKDFDKSYKPKIVEPRLLQNTYESIQQMLGCPKVEEEAEGTPEAAPGDGAEAPAGEPKGEVKEDPPGDGDKTPEPVPEEPEGKDASKKKEAPKKDSGKKAKK